jgi:ribosomal protein S18 acetylase RimI-like enzyme
MSKPEPKKASVREIVYRPAVPEDSQTISDLLLEAFGEFKSEYTPGAFDYTTPGVEIVRGRFEEGPIWVAIDGDVMAGTVSGLPEPDRFYIRSMAVKPGMQGRGIGKSCLTFWKVMLASLVLKSFTFTRRSSCRRHIGCMRRMGFTF